MADEVTTTEVQEQLRHVLAALQALVAGELPDGTAIALPVEVTNVSGDVTLNVDEIDGVAITNKPNVAVPDGVAITGTPTVQGAGLTATTVALANATTTDAVAVPRDAKSFFLRSFAFSGTPDVTIQASENGTTFANLWEWASGLTQVKVTASAGDRIIGPIICTGLSHIRVVTSTNQTGTFGIGFR